MRSASPRRTSRRRCTLISGAPVTTIRDGIEKVGVVARAVPSERLDLGRVGTDDHVKERSGCAAAANCKNRICA